VRWHDTASTVRRPVWRLAVRVRATATVMCDVAMVAMLYKALALAMALMLRYFYYEVRT